MKSKIDILGHRSATGLAPDLIKLLSWCLINVIPDIRLNEDRRTNVCTHAYTRSCRE